MECRLKTSLGSLAKELAQAHAEELAAAGTLVDLEELACEVGDELTRLLTEGELARRGTEEIQEEAECPDCGRLSAVEDDEPVVLQGLRGELAYTQPKHFCNRCRRSFFPDGGSLGNASAEHGDPQSTPENSLGRKQ
jgi:hypothetical protein